MKVICVLNTGRDIAKIGYELGKFKSNVINAARDVRRAVRNGWSGVEDLVDDVTVAVKREPLKSIGFTLGVALGIGTFAGWFATRQR